MASKTIARVIREHSSHLLKIPGVVGISQGLVGNQPYVRILVKQRTPALQESLPQVLDGYPVAVEITGPLEAVDEQ